MIKLNIPSYIIKWTAEFLKNRRFCVDVNGEKSTLRDIRAGVPQGAVLSPILFSIFINDIPIENSTNRSYGLLFADDLAKIFIFKKPGKLELLVNKYLKNIVKWLQKWRLKMNVSKTKYTIFSKSANTRKDFTFSLYDMKLKRDPNPKFLGVTFDESLSFGPQVKEIKEKCIKRLNILKILSHKSWHLKTNILLNIYKSLIRSIIDYNSFILKSLSIANLNTLQIIQNKAIKSIFKLRYDFPSELLSGISGMVDISTRMSTLCKNYFDKAFISNNQLMALLKEEYNRSYNAIEKNDKKKTLLFYYK